MVRGAGTTIQDGIERYNKWSDGQHDSHALNHAATVLTQLSGLSLGLLKQGPDDPYLFAYLLREHFPKLQGYVNDLDQWSKWVIQADPSEIPPVGAK